MNAVSQFGNLNEFGIAAIVLVVFALILIARAVKTVPQGQEWTVERFGRYSRTLRPGLRFLIPLLERVGERLIMMETVLDVDGQEVITRDNAMVHADAIAFYQVVNAAQAAYEVKDLQRALTNLSATNIRTVIGAMDLDDVLSNRDLINSKLLGVIDEAANPWGVKVTRVEIRDLRPPADIVEAMGRQMKAEREKRAEVLQAEGEKQSAILKAEGEREAQIREAEGRREAAFLDAQARERLAEAEAKATEMVSRAIAEGDVQAVNYFVAQKYVESLQAIGAAPNTKTVILPIEAGAIAGAIAGIAELTGSIKASPSAPAVRSDPLPPRPTPVTASPALDLGPPQQVGTQSAAQPAEAERDATGRPTGPAGPRRGGIDDGGA
ncbi:MAG: SPFH domain-containing protein [Pseudomonadota bacterium]